MPLFSMFKWWHLCTIANLLWLYSYRRIKNNFWCNKRPFYCIVIRPNWSKCIITLWSLLLYQFKKRMIPKLLSRLILTVNKRATMFTFINCATLIEEFWHWGSNISVLIAGSYNYSYSTLVIEYFHKHFEPNTLFANA